ncbi:MAG: hypothetical protein WC657_01990 [Candidatus Paceibacterota bacterium]|jgi:DNA polymerase III delta prime subunit
MHHANIIISKEDCRDHVFDILGKELNFDTKANPDFSIIDQETFGIDDAREFIKWAISKPLLSETKVSLIITKSITLEAQNALLKVLEEPTLGTHIFINLESLGGILPTFISRVRILDLPQNDLENNVSSKKFLSADLKGKLAIIRSLSKKEDKNEMKELINDLENIAYQNKGSSNQMKNVLIAKIFATSRGSSPKMLLEWLSAVLPSSEF